MATTAPASPLLKSADDKSRRLALLQELQNAPLLDVRQRDWLRDERQRLERGLQGERDAAFYIDAEFRDAQNHVVLHDLRAKDQLSRGQVLLEPRRPVWWVSVLPGASGDCCGLMVESPLR